MKSAILAVAFLGFGFLASCASDDRHEPRFAGAQAVVDETMGRHSGLARLSLHAIPSGETACVCVGSTDESRRGKRSDPEDVDAMRMNKSITLREGQLVDVTVPILGKAGAPIAAAGITVEVASDSAEDQAEAESLAHSIALEMQNDINASPKPLW